MNLSVSLIVFLFKSYFRSYRYFPIFLCYFIGVMMLYSYRPNPVMDSYAISSVFLYFISTWLCSSFLSSMNEVQEQITSLHAGSVRTYLIGRTAMIFLLCTSLSLFAMMYPMVTNMFDQAVTWTQWLTAFAVHIEMSLLGMLIALFFNKTFVKNTSLSISGMLFVLIVTLSMQGVVNSAGSGFSLLFWVLPPAIETFSILMNYDKQSVLKSTITLSVSFAYFVLFFYIYLKLQIKKMYE